MPSWRALFWHGLTHGRAAGCNHRAEEALLDDGAVRGDAVGELGEDPPPVERFVLPAQPVGPDRARVRLRGGPMRSTSDVGRAGRERLGLLDDVVEDRRPTEALLGRGLHQRRLERGEPGPADLVRAALHAQQPGGPELGAG
ncbi:hypothetical protein ACFUN7_27830 [Streptomyces sp. NPDC057236]|uniref:hypothetical protein n=1 Tax=Streptomyces sp. NPDC057236 TaxID=3346059 RepID=UPI003640D8D7